MPNWLAFLLFVFLQQNLQQGKGVTMENVQWKVEGMDCSSCALTIHKYLEKQGMKNVKVNSVSGDVSFEMNGSPATTKLIKGLDDLGYHVANQQQVTEKKKPFFSTHLHRFFFCLPFALVFVLHMIFGMRMHWIANPWLQLVLTIPVYIVCMDFFGRSAWKSLRNGLPNMNVLVALGSTAAFAYSLYGTLTGQPENFMFYETSVTIITLVFLGNYLEDASIQSTQRELKKLVKSQKVMANMIAFDENHHEVILPVENSSLRHGDLILIKTGEQIPTDCRILSGTLSVNEAIITGESLPVEKGNKDILI